jgi:hemerythrin superfamily protein
MKIVEDSLEDILNKKKITDSSRKLYNSNFVRLNDGNPVLKFDFLKDVPVILEKLSKYKPNTQRGYIISITSLMGDLKETNPKKYKKTYETYYKLLTEYNTTLKDQTAQSSNEKTNWLTPEKKQEVINECDKIIEVIGNKRKITEEQYNKLFECLVLALYTKIPPRRNVDYQDMLIVKKNTPPDAINNFLDVVSKKFIFNKYKTAGSYKTQTIDIPDDLMKIITLYLKHRPKYLLEKDTAKEGEDTNQFLVSFVGEPYTQNNAITRILNKIFDGKVGASLLRKLYLTDKYANTMDELKSDVAQMGTSVDVAKHNYIKALN